MSYNQTELVADKLCYVLWKIFSHIHWNMKNAYNCILGSTNSWSERGSSDSYT